MSLVARVACSSYADAEKAVARALEILGGPGLFAAKGEPVLVKPNLLCPGGAEKAISTHPAVVGAALQILLDMGAKPVVGDSPGFGGAKLVARTTGLLKTCKRLGVGIIDLSDEGTREVRAETFRSLELAVEALEAKRIWNIPKWKTHSMMGMTLGVKNLYGAVPGKRKVAGHLRAGRDRDAFAAMLLDIHGLIRPSVTILDGVTAMEGAGPSSGTPIHRGLILASSDAPALDHEAARLSGFAPLTIPTVNLTVKNGILDPGGIRIEGDDAEIMRFAPPPGSGIDFGFLPGPLKRLIRGMVSPAPVFAGETCDDCSVCVEACPVRALQPGKPPVLSKEACIRCYCCQELCPKGAVSVPAPFFRSRRRNG